MTWVNSTASARLESSGVLVIFGGYDNNDQSLGDTWLLSLSRQLWRQISSSSSPTPRHHHSMVARDSFVYLHGGRGVTGYNDVWRFDVITEEWLQMNSPASPLPNRFQFSMAILGQKVYVHGWCSRRMTTPTSIISTTNSGILISLFSVPLRSIKGQVVARHVQVVRQDPIYSMRARPRVILSASPAHSAAAMNTWMLNVPPHLTLSASQQRRHRLVLAVGVPFC